ncbi:hypothetical protein ABPG72_019541 [Tetrahymena utriculariae]
MSKYIDPNIDNIVKRKKQTQIFKYKYYSEQFTAQEQKIINQALNILSRDYSAQKESLNYEEAKFVCYYFYSVFEISRRDFSFLDKELFQLYHIDGQMNEFRKVIDIILNLKKLQPSLQLRSVGLYNQSEIADNLSEKQIIQIEKTWSNFDEEQEGFICCSDVEQPIFQLLSVYGIDKNHPDMSKIKEFVDAWKQKTGFYIFFNEYASLVCEINSRFDLLKKSKKTSCTCSIF